VEKRTHSFSERAGVLATILGLMLTVAAFYPGDPDSDLGPESSTVKKVLLLHNKARAERGLGELRWSTSLETAATLHSKDCATRKKLTHDGSTGSEVINRTRSSGYRGNAVGENIAKTPDDYASNVFGLWMESSGHKSNILDRSWIDVGIAVEPDGDDYFYWTVVFGGGEPKEETVKKQVEKKDTKKEKPKDGPDPEKPKAEPKDDVRPR
jgi:uncharacterized protein YkwD